MFEDILKDGRNLIAISGLNLGLFFSNLHGSVIASIITLAVACAGFYVGYKRSIPVERKD